MLEPGKTDPVCIADENPFLVRMFPKFFPINESINGSKVHLDHNQDSADNIA